MSIGNPDFDGDIGELSRQLDDRDSSRVDVLFFGRRALLRRSFSISQYPEHRKGGRM